jgi:phosphoesterase RecJ-like protein
MTKELKNLYKELFKKIKEFKKIIITPHGRPDGDCIGSALGLKDIIQTTYPEKLVYASGEETDYLKFLGRLDSLEEEDFKDALVIAVDTANKERIADQRYNQGAYLIKIDHHILVDSYGEIEIVDTNSPAVCEMIVDFYTLFEKKLSLSKEGAKALYTGILTDTGRFKYSGVSAKTFKAVATLYDLGLNASEVHSHLEVMSENLIRFKGYVLLNYQKTENGVAYIKITDELRKEFNVTTEESSSLVNELSHFEDCPIWVLMAEYEENIVRARIRSSEPDISKTANLFNGGGHSRASGANLGTWERGEALLKALDEVAKSYKESL